MVSENLVVHRDDVSTGYRLGVPIETRAFQLTGYSAPGDGVFLARDTVRDDFTSATEIAYDASPDTGFEKRLIQREIVRYYNTASLPDLLDFGAVDPKALTYESYVLDITPTLLTTVFGSDITTPILEEGGYTTPSTTSGHWLPSGHAVFDAAHFYLPETIVDPFGNETAIAYDETTWLFATSVTDEIGNVVSTIHDHRVLAPSEVTEPNGNREQASFDELGMLKHVAIMGKSGGSDGDTLSDPTVVYTYALTEWDDDDKPNYVHVAAREVHGSSSSPWRESKVFSDGSGGVAMTKTQAEPAPGTSDPRWVGSGRTVINNKGNPIKQYEPYFSDNFDFEDEDEIVATGVTAVLTYDALGRVKRTDFPNGTASRVTRTAWLETVFDQNDTVNDAGNIWNSARAGLPSTDPEKKALLRTQDHALTPTETHIDSMGRAFLVKAHNKVGGADEFHETRTTLDVQGRVLVVVDALDRVCQTNVYSAVGSLLKETNLDKGSRKSFYDATGQVVRRFDDRDQVFRTTYDVLRRPTHLYMKPGAGAELLLQRSMFGDDAGITTPETNNLRGKVVRLFDGAGRTKSESYDFKGNSLTSDRKLAVAYMTTPDWSDIASETTASGIDSAAASLLESETFTESRTFDAMNRITKVTTPDASEFLPTYNEAGLLEAVEVKVRGAGTATTFVTNIDYDAKGQRTAIVYGNGTATAYGYDRLTFRLTTLATTRTSPSAILQDLSYTYDPVGNVMQVTDAAHQTVFFNNAVVLPENEYVYDAVYRLISGKGREHKSIGLVQVDNNDCALENLPHANDSDALRNYEETYEYDKVGNILEMFHDAGTNTWTRTYAYESSPSTNRLASHNIPGGTATYTHDLHGSMTSMPHLSGGITWTPLDQMQSASNGTQDTYFTYGADGARVRKVYDTNANLIKERIYLGSFEIYRERTSSGVQVERETLHVNDGTKRIAMVETKTRSGGAAVPTPVPMFRFQLGNHLGSAVLEVDQTGLVISYEETSPYGSTCYRSSDGSVDVSARRYRYVGLERDEETGMYLMGARYYAAWLGRWASADPMGIGADGPGIYNYTRGSPVVLTDPSGMDASKEGGAEGEGSGPDHASLEEARELERQEHEAEAYAEEREAVSQLVQHERDAAGGSIFRKVVKTGKGGDGYDYELNENLLREMGRTEENIAHLRAQLEAHPELVPKGKAAPTDSLNYVLAGESARHIRSATPDEVDLENDAIVKAAAAKRGQIAQDLAAGVAARGAKADRRLRGTRRPSSNPPPNGASPPVIDLVGAKNGDAAQSELSRMVARMKGLKAGAVRAITDVEAFGSRAGSQYRGRGPHAGSDLDLIVTDTPGAFASSRFDKPLRALLHRITGDFTAITGIKVDLKIGSDDRRMRVMMTGPFKKL